MPQITVYECPFTGDIFHGKAKYAKHLREYRRELRERREEKRGLARWDESLAQASKEIENLDGLAKWFIKNQWSLYSWVRDTFGKRVTCDVSEPIVVKLKFTNFIFNERARNTHSCPRNGEQNWNCKRELPQGYPGMYGRLDIWTVKGDFGFWAADALKAASICTGSGGGGGIDKSTPPIAHYTYDCTLWLNDWVELGIDFTFAKLNGSQLKPISGEHHVQKYFS